MQQLSHMRSPPPGGGAGGGGAPNSPFLRGGWKGDCDHRFRLSSPGPTRNPRNLDHTPGGSSSGSAAAVRRGHGAFHDRRTDERVDDSARFILRPYRFQADPRSSPNGGCAALGQESGHPWSLYAHATDSAGALWKALGHPEGGGRANFRWLSTNRFLNASPKWQTPFGNGIVLRRAGVASSQSKFRNA